MDSVEESGSSPVEGAVRMNSWAKSQCYFEMELHSVNDSATSTTTLANLFKEPSCSGSKETELGVPAVIDEDSQSEDGPIQEEIVPQEMESTSLKEKAPTQLQEEIKVDQIKARKPKVFIPPTSALKASLAAIKKWRNRTIAEKMLANHSIAKNPEHQDILDQQVIRAYTEIPRSLITDILDEAIPITQKAVQMYRQYLGPTNDLTLQGMAHIEALKKRRQDSRSPAYY
eukprot:m.61126 g.61126  ORF g.61126 m.61126 type:complete len:229 (+) comp34973_c0_seq1:3405-4091(+)